MVDRQHIFHHLQCSVVRIASRATSAVIGLGFVALAVAVPRMVVRLEGDTLIRDGGGAGSSILTPLSETRFMVGNNPAFVVEFVLDDAGVTQVMGSGYQQMLARRMSGR